MIQIRPEQCTDLGKKIRDLKVVNNMIHPAFPENTSEEDKANYWFYITGICHQLSALEGMINGTKYYGADYFIFSTIRKPAFFRLEHVLKVTHRELKALVSDKGYPHTSLLDRVEERGRLLKDMAAFVKHRSSINNIFTEAEGKVDRLLELISICEAYSDPVQKKSHLFLITMHQTGLWKLKDPGSLRIPVDYHITRIALRTGMIEVRDKRLRESLYKKERVREAVTTRIRKQVKEACRIIQKESSMAIFNLDAVLWNIGRNCCHQYHDPVCRNDHMKIWDCPLSRRCSLIKTFAHDCQGKCPFDGCCKASRDDAYRNYFEPVTETHYY